MTRYYCDVCHKEIEGWYHEVKISLQATGIKRSPRKAKLHFHDECLAKFMEALEKETYGSLRKRNGGIKNEKCHLER